MSTFVYALIADSPNILRSDGAMIPDDPLNADYRDYLAWVAGGGVPTPVATPAAPVPTCALWQLEAADSAQWAAITAAVSALGNPVVTAFFNHGTNVIPANSTTLLALGASLGLTAAQVTALIATAAAIAIP